jgi:hypothetical protein
VPLPVLLASQRTQHVTRVHSRKGGVTGAGRRRAEGHGRDVLETVAEGQSVSVSARHRSRLHRLFFTSLQRSSIDKLPESHHVHFSSSSFSNKQKYRQRLAARSFVKFKK